MGIYCFKRYMESPYLQLVFVCKMRQWRFHKIRLIKQERSQRT